MSNSSSSSSNFHPTGKYKARNGQIVNVRNGLDEDNEDVSGEIANGNLVPISAAPLSESAFSSESPNVTSTSSSISPDEVYKNQETPMLLEAGKSLAFPLASAASTIADALPSGNIKNSVQDYVVPSAAGVDAGLNYLTVTGFGAAPKAGAIAAGGTLQGLAKIIPNALEKGAKYLATKNPAFKRSLAQITEGKITGQEAADVAKVALEEKQRNLTKSQIFDKEILEKYLNRIEEIEAKGARATNSELLEKQTLEVESRMLKSNIGYTEKELSKVIGLGIHNLPEVQRATNLQMSPFAPMVAKKTGEVGQKAGGLYLGSEFLASLLKPNEDKLTAQVDSIPFFNRGK